MLRYGVKTMKKIAENSVIYGVYPTSFYDSNGDGIGDIQGIIQKLEYIQSLGVDIIWVNPMYKSPFKDGGYDVADYYAIDEKFGTLSDAEELIKAVHARGMKILFDLVIGHTSDQHAWFKQSAKPTKNEYSDYSIWTNSIFVGGNHCINGMYKRNGNYIVNYYAFQPALNYGYREVEEGGDAYSSGGWKKHYKDPALTPVHEEMEKVIDFWLSKGIDGYRCDLVPSLIKGGDLEAISWIWKKLTKKAKEKYPQCIFMAEWGRPELSAACGFDLDYLNHESTGYNEMFRGESGANILPAFECGNSYFAREGKGSKTALSSYTQKLYEELPKECKYVIPSGYHDMIRLGQNKTEAEMKCIFAYLTTYRNVPMIYYGDEIGIKHNFRVNKDGGYVRTGARTPMQWSEDKNKGFSTADKIYLPVEKKGNSVTLQEQDENSLLNTVRKLIKIRKKYPAFDYDGDLIERKGEYPLVYWREKEGVKAFVAINPTQKIYRVKEKITEVLFETNVERKGGQITLLPFGIFIGLLK